MPELPRATPRFQTPRVSEVSDYNDYQDREDERPRVASGAYEGPEATIKKNRVVIGSILLSGIMLMILISFLPFWITVHKTGAYGPNGSDAEIFFMFGPYSLQFHGIVHTASTILEECREAVREGQPPLLSIDGCDVLREVSHISNVLLGSYVAILIGLMYGTIHLLVGRVRMAIVYWTACVISTVSVTQIFYGVGKSTAAKYEFAASTGSCSLLFIIVSCLVSLDVVLVTVLWLLARDEWSTMGVDAEYMRTHSLPGSKPLHRLKKASGKIRKRYNQVNAPDYDREVHMCGLGHCYVLTETGIVKRQVQQRGYLGYLTGTLWFLATIPIHFLKTFDWGPIRMSWFGPQSEMESVRKHGKISSTIVVNYMIYRRSNMICVVAFGVPLFLYRLSLLSEKWNHISRTAEETKRVSFKDWSVGREDPTWKDYTNLVGAQILKSLASNFKANGVFQILIGLGLLAFAVACSCIAIKRWYNFRHTRAMLNLGFIGYCSVAVLQSLSTFSGSHDFQNVNMLANGYLDDLKEYFDAREWMTKCVELNIPYLVANAAVSLNSYCPKIPAGVWDLRGGTIKTASETAMGKNLQGVYDFRPYATYCEMAQNITGRGDVEEVAQFTHAACKMFDNLLYNSSIEELASEGERKLNDLHELKEQNSPVAITERAKVSLRQIERLDAEAEQLASQLAQVRAESEFLKRQTLPASAGSSSFAAEVPKKSATCTRETEVLCNMRWYHFTSWLGADDCESLGSTCTKFADGGFRCLCNEGTCWEGSIQSSRCKAVYQIEQEKFEAQRSAALYLERYKTKFEFQPAELRQRIANAIVEVQSIIGTGEDAIDGVMNLCALMFLVNGLGPGIVIAAMTAKLIFANSTLPGKFIIAFPIFFCPSVFAFYGLAWVVVRDAEFAIVMILWSFWPVLVAIIAKWTGFHLPMSDERAMFMANYMLLAYYFWIILSYIVILRYALIWSPTTEMNWYEPAVWLNNKPRELVWGYIAGNLSEMKWFYLLCDQFVSYFLTCLAVGDFFIVATVQEHKYAWRELLEGEDIVIGASTRKDVLQTQSSALYRAEREMIDDWVTLLGGVPMMVGLTGKRVDEEPELLSCNHAENAPGQQVMFAVSPPSSPGDSPRSSVSVVVGKNGSVESPVLSFEVNVQEIQRARDASSEVIEYAPNHTDSVIELEERAAPANNAEGNSNDREEKQRASSLNGLQ